MSDVLITPASSKIEFKDADSNIDGTIQLDASDHLKLSATSSNVHRSIDEANATVGPGWVTVAENTSNRRHGEVLVSDSDSSDHAFIRIDWMRSYADSNFTVINCGGHGNRITGARVLSQDSDSTYGKKILQVYVTVSSNYRVQVSQIQNQSGWSGHSATTPVVENTKTGYSLHGSELTSLDSYGFATEEGLRVGDDLKVDGTSRLETIVFANLEKSNLTADGQLGFDSSQGLLVYRTQQNTGLSSETATTVLDGCNVEAGTGISITNLTSGGTSTEKFTFSLGNHSAALLTTGTLNKDRLPTTINGTTVSGTLTIGDGTAQTELHIKKADNDVSDHLQFYNGTTRIGEIGTQDTTWLRINQVTNKNIYTPRYIRADNGFFVDGTSKGINGSGNFIGGTITGASDANVSNWDTAYGWGDHSTAGYLSTNTDTTITGALTIDVDNKANGALRINANQTSPAQDFYFAQEIVSTLSGSQTFTGDMEQGGIYMDINSTATGGGTSHEHRAYGIYVDLDTTGDADVAYGIFADSTVTPTTGTVSSAYGIYGRAEDNGGAGSVSTVIGVRGEASSDNSTSDINNMYGGYFRSTNVADTGNIAEATGCYAEIEIPSGTGDHYANSYVFRAEYDNNDSGVAQTNTTYLYYGNYAGTQPTTAYGIYINDTVSNYLPGRLDVGAIYTTGELNLQSGSDASKYMDCRIGTNSFHIRKTTGGDAGHEVMARFTGDAGVDLYYDNVIKFSTTSTGASVSGELSFGDGDGTGGSNKIALGADDDLNIYHDGSHSYINNTGTGNLRLESASNSIDLNGNNLIEVEDIYLRDRIYHDGDTDTYIQFHAANQWRVVTGGVERLEVNGERIYARGDLINNDTGGNLALEVKGDLGNFRVNQNVSTWTSTSHPILMWDYKTGPGDMMYMASGGNTTITDQMAIVISDGHGFKVGKSGWDGTDTDIGTEYFRVDTSGGVNIPAGTLTIDGNASQMLLHPGTNNQTVIARNDGSNFYFLLSNAGAAASGTWNSLRPFYINTSTGMLHSNNGQDFAGGMSTGNITFDSSALLIHNDTDSYDKIRVWNSSSYSIGMKSAQTHGALNDYAMTFTMNDDTDRGWLWRDTAHASTSGAMSLSTNGKLTVSRGINVGRGESSEDYTDYSLLVDNAWQTGQNNSYNVTLLDADWSGTAAFTANRSSITLRVDTDNSRSNTTNTSGNRHTIYGIHATCNSTKHVYDQIGVYGFSNVTHDSSSIGAQSVRGVYGYAQAYAAGGNVNAYGGFFLGYRGGSVTGGTLYGVYGKAQNTTNGSGKSGNAIGGYFEVECDEDTIPDAKAVQAHIDRDGGTITTGYLYYGSYAGTVTTKRGIWLTNSTENELGGNLTCSGNVTAYSDIKLKENIETLENSLDKVCKLRGVSFNRKDIEGKPKQIGVIAQEIEKIVPEVVSESPQVDEDGKDTGEYTKGVSYGNLTALLIEAIKEQQQQIDELRQEIKNIKGHK